MATPHVLGFREPDCKLLQPNQYTALYDYTLKYCCSKCLTFINLCEVLYFINRQTVPGSQGTEMAENLTKVNSVIFITRMLTKSEDSDRAAFPDKKHYFRLLFSGAIVARIIATNSRTVSTQFPP
ncbi:hypothetical protein CISG_04960 [Coccidioides immitis RMSCC 3703]|uniref:Uncharacterized protein n=1 Tax=Coccidioides immitis RMSCC 3703 TaxID=454286 RepID=A0A0J8TP90_COCIT|nr:hypothetical protein CISG_04960 [Coccidioides immitis RMSCC 3703]